MTPRPLNIPIPLYVQYVTPSLLPLFLSSSNKRQHLSSIPPESYTALIITPSDQGGETASAYVWTVYRGGRTRDVSVIVKSIWHTFHKTTKKKKKEKEACDKKWLEQKQKNLTPSSVSLAVKFFWVNLYYADPVSSLGVWFFCHFKTPRKDESFHLAFAWEVNFISHLATLSFSHAKKNKKHKFSAHTLSHTHTICK